MKDSVRELENHLQQEVKTTSTKESLKLYRRSMYSVFQDLRAFTE